MPLLSHNLPMNGSFRRRLVKAFLKVADDAKDFVKFWHVAEKHFAPHGLVILPPESQLVGGRDKAERTGPKGGVIYPRPAEENFAMCGDSLEQAGIGHRLSGNAFVDETPKVVIMPRETHLARLVRRTKGFFMEEHGLFPKCAAWCDCVNGKCIRAENLRKRFRKI